MKEDIVWKIKESIKKLYAIDFDTITLENPPKPEFWDFAFPCFLLARELKKSPQIIAWEMKDFIEKETSFHSFFQEVSLAWGYLNLKLKNSFISRYFFDAYQKQSLFASFPQKNETIIIDYIGTNVGKPLHIGHMCTPNIGQTLVNLYEKLGYNVIGDSHIGDWGIIFGKLLYVWKNIDNDQIEIRIMRYKNDEKFDEIFWMNREERLNFLLEQEWVDFLLTLYWIFHYSNTDISSDEFEKLFDISLKTQMEEREEGARNEFKLLSEWNIESIKLWEKITRQSIDFMQVQLDRLHVKADYNIGESFYEGIGIPKLGNYPDLQFTMKNIVEELIQKKIATQNEDGSVGIIFPEETKLPSCILQKRDGTHWYLASDLATIHYRTLNSEKKIRDENKIFWWNLKKVIYSVDIRQELHLKQVFDIARRAGWVDEIELFHAGNGFISLKDWAMSTRTWKIIPLKDLLDEAEARAEKIILEKRQDIQGTELKKLKKIIGIWAIKYGYLSKSRLTNVVFDWDEFMTFEGNSAPYIQYAYVRAKSILAQAEDLNLCYSEIISESLEEKEEIELMKELLKYEEILLQTAKENMPHLIANYAYEITRKFNTFYNNCHILSEKDEQKKYMRLKLLEIFCAILKDTFEILAIEMPERM